MVRGVKKFSPPKGVKEFLHFLHPVLLLQDHKWIYLVNPYYCFNDILCSIDFFLLHDSLFMVIPAIRLFSMQIRDAIGELMAY